MDLTVLGLLGVVVLVLLIFLGMNIGLAMAAVGFVGFAMITDTETAFSLFRTVPFTNASSYSLSVIPLFVLMGQLAYHSGISRGLFDAAEKWLTKMRGSLCVASIVTAAGFSAICGSATATAATMATLALPETRKAGYDDGMTTGCIAAGGTLGTLIPPSTGFMVYGITANQSVGRLFAAGIVPGIILAIFFIIVLQVCCKINPEMAPATNKSYPMKEKVRSLLGALPILFLFFIVIGGIFSGIVTATEAASVGALVSLIFLIIRKKFTFKTLIQALYETMKTSAMIFMVYIGACVFGYFLTITMIPATLARFVASLAVPSFVIILIILGIYLFLGCIMDAMAMMLLTVPIFLPIIEALGYDLIWFGVLIVLVMQQGMITPPVGLNVYVLAGMCRDVPMPKIFKGAIPYVLAIFACAVLILIFPDLTTWLPNLIYG